MLVCAASVVTICWRAAISVTGGDAGTTAANTGTGAGDTDCCIGGVAVTAGTSLKASCIEKVQILIITILIKHLMSFCTSYQ